MAAIPDELFKWHKPGATAQKQIAQLREIYDALFQTITAQMPPSRERSLAITHLHQSNASANLACIFADPESVTVDHAGVIMLPELHKKG